MSKIIKLTSLSREFKRAVSFLAVIAALFTASPGIVAPTVSASIYNGDVHANSLSAKTRYEAQEMVMVGGLGKAPSILGLDVKEGSKVLFGHGSGVVQAMLPQALVGAELKATQERFIVPVNKSSLAERVREVNEKIVAAKIRLKQAKDQEQKSELSALIKQLSASRKIILAENRDILRGDIIRHENELKSLAPSLRVREVFQNTFAGFSAELSSDEAEALKQKGYVLYPDVRIKAALADSVPMIKAPAVWQMLDAGSSTITGVDVSIAIVDTGVDYNHTDLGGCLGIACKVVGGYDFVNGDQNPIDDNGHGTHVAAIAAGKGALNGVAPDAKILAYKVLDASGNGWSEDVILGIERAMDPDNDGDFADSVDVINLSLSGFGSPDDPLSLAADRAAAAGVVVVAAAGNGGVGTATDGTVGTPGSARKVITVAAVNKSGEMANFSSRGPVVWDGKVILKPDIAAPGVSICAAEHDNWLAQARCLDNSHIAISGTSMASPHVAGAAALIRQAHPEWTPDEIKAALKHVASPASGTLIDRGAGILDVHAGVLEQNPIVVELQPIPSASAYRAVKALVSGKDIQNWSLSISAANGANWDEVASGLGTFLPSKTLYTIPAGKYADGEYYIRLTVTDFSGRSFSDYGYIPVEKFSVTAPSAGNIYGIGESVVIRYVLSGSSAKKITYGYMREGGVESEQTIGLDKSNWTILSKSTWNTSNLVGGWYKLGVWAEQANGVEDFDYVRVYVDDTLKSGWPVAVEWDICPSVWGKCDIWGGMNVPVVSDIDGDGTKEIFVLKGGNPPRILVYRAGGQVLLNIRVGDVPALGGDLSMPLVVDIDGDGKKEIFAMTTNDRFGTRGDWEQAKLFGFNYRGRLLPGWPVMLPKDYLSTMAYADVDNDGQGEIIVQSNESNNPKISILGVDGIIERQWSLPKSSWRSLIEGTPAVGNFDEDADLEIVVNLPSPNAGVAIDASGNVGEFINEGDVHVFNLDGSEVPGWPVRVPGMPFGSPAVGDVDHDGKPEVAVTTFYASAGLYPDQRFGGVHLLNQNGGVVPGWPVNMGSDYLSSPILVDLDGDSDLEVVASRLGYPETSAFHHTGQVVAGWPRVLSWSDYFSPISGDADGDGNPDIITTAGSGWIGGGVIGRNALGEMLAGFPKITEVDAQAPAVIDDLEGDGVPEIIASSDWDYDWNKQEFKSRGSLYVWEMKNPASANANQWPTFHHDNERTGLYPFLPVPVASSSPDLDAPTSSVEIVE